MTLEPLRAAPDREQHDVILGPATVRSRRSSLERTALRATNTSNQEKEIPPRPRLRRDARRIKRSKGSLWRRVMGLSEANSAEIPRCVEISGPTNFRHNFHATFDTTSVTFAGLPTRWNQQTTLINRQFGIPLRSAPRVEVEGYAARIPAVLVLLRRELIDNGGLRHEGVFRVSANKSTQLHYKTQLDAGQFRGCVSSTDATCMAALIKEWFRALPEPLLQCLPRDLIVSVAARTDNDEQASEELLRRLPEPNQSVFLWLLDLLADTAQYETINRMSIKALGIVLAPNLYTVSPTASPMEVVALMDAAVKAVQLCLRMRSQTPRPTLAPQDQHTLLT